VTVLGGLHPPGHVVLAPMVSLVLDGLLLRLVVPGRDLLPGLFLLLLFLVGSVLLIFELLVVASDILVLTILLIVVFLLGEFGSKFELALDFHNENNKEPLLHTRLGARKENLADA
jgi:hypothetical protein